MSDTETMDAIPLGHFKVFRQDSDDAACATRGRVVIQSFRAVPRADGTILMEVRDGDSVVTLTVDQDDARRFGRMLERAATAGVSP